MSDIELERDEASVLGLVMFPAAVDAFDDALRVVAPADFNDTTRGAVWAAASALRHDGIEIEIGALHSQLRRHVGGRQLDAAYELVVRECTTAPVPQWALASAKRVAAAARKRQLSAIGQRLQQLSALDLGMDDAGYSAQLRSVLDELDEIDSSRRVDDVVEIGEYAAEYLGGLTDGPPTEVIPTPWEDLNRLFSGGGLRPGGLYLFGARPGDGKTLAGGAFAMGAAEQGYSGLFFSAEMTRRELMDRWMARALREELSEFTSFAPSARVLAGAAAHAEWIKANGLRLGIVDTAGMTVPYISATARRRQRRTGLDFLVVDYLQLLTPTTGRNREESVGDMSSALKQLAKELSIPVVALAQLNRAGSDTPRKEHLRETGRLEQDADGIILLHRPMEEIDGRPVPDGNIDFIVDKNRHGRTGTVTLRWRAHWGDITERD